VAGNRLTFRQWLRETFGKGQRQYAYTTGLEETYEEGLSYDTTQTFDMENGTWGEGWVEVTVLGDEYRRFQKPDGGIVEVPFGEHTDEEE
jgi:hypothetical protein